MLSSVLRSERAADVNIAIMRAFVRLRQVLNSNKAFENRIMELMSNHAIPRKRIVGLDDSDR